MLQIQKFGLEKEIIELKAQNFSTRQIAEDLTKRGFEISHTTINRYLNSDSEIKKETIQKSNELREKLVAEELDIYQQLIEANRLLVRKLDEIKDSEDHYAIQGYLKELRAQAEFIIKQLGELKPDKQIIAVNYVQENLLQVVQELNDEQVRILMTFLVEKRDGLSKINKIDMSYFIAKSMEEVEKTGYIFIKIQDDETNQLIKNLEKECKIQILTRNTEF